jgi:hypothetical protein
MAQYACNIAAELIMTSILAEAQNQGLHPENPASKLNLPTTKTVR